ncbi:MAG: portal protein [Gammaproteobacteria bacterium]
MSREAIDRQLKRWNGLRLERSSYDQHWEELARFFMPRAGRFFRTKRNTKGGKQHQHILDSSGIRSMRVLAAGLMAGMTSPARPWLRLKTPDDDLNEFHTVKNWTSIVTQRMLDIFAGSNTYRALPMLYEELAVFGTAPDFVLSDFDFVIHHTPLTVGEYAIATDERGMVNTLYREFEMTVAQCVDAFGLENVSTWVRNLYQQGHGYDRWVPVMHVVEPRRDRDVTKRDARNMPWTSCYFEIGSHDGRYLRESGFRRFPAVCPRWHVYSGDIYGSSPGMEALGDVKQLQHQQLRKGQGIDLQTQPPLQVPTALRNRGVAAQPGGITYVDATGPGAGVRSLFDVRIELQYLLQDIMDVRQRISRAFYEDLFLMLATTDRRQITAREIAERHEEKLLMLGPVLERLHNELLAPLIDITFDHMLEAGIVPPPPPELQGMELEVEFISMLAQAQRAVGIASTDRLLGTIASFAQFKPEVLDKIDADQVVDVYADMLGVDPSMIVGDEQVAIIRQERAAQEQALLAAQTAPAVAQTAKTLSEVDTSQPNALTQAFDLLGA